jgi:hypothetical protein
MDRLPPTVMFWAGARPTTVRAPARSSSGARHERVTRTRRAGRGNRGRPDGDPRSSRGPWGPWAELALPASPGGAAVAAEPVAVFQSGCASRSCRTARSDREDHDPSTAYLLVVQCPDLPGCLRLLEVLNRVVGVVG